MFDLYFLFDKSEAMAKVDPPDTTTRWLRAKAGFNTFIETEQLGLPIRTAFGFYPKLADGSVTPSCAVMDYAAPVLDFESPRPAARWIQTIDKQTVGSESAALPALEGAYRHAAKWAVSPSPPNVPEDLPPSIVLMMGATPTGCGSSVDALAASAAVAFKGPPRIRTYVVAIGPDARGLEPIAIAGGTDRVYSAPPREIGDALQRIARARNICDLPYVALSSTQNAALEMRARLVHTAPLAALPRVSGIESCATGGWFVEPRADGILIALCPSTCAEIVDAPAGQAVAGLPCEVPPPPP
jgi:hypothetical protein